MRFNFLELKLWKFANLKESVFLYVWYGHTEDTFLLYIYLFIKWIFNELFCPKFYAHAVNNIKS